LKKIFLSYLLNEDLSAYGNGKRMSLEFPNDQDKGDSCNGSEIFLPTHFGTHIDFPFHFSKNHKTSDKYYAEEFIFNNIELIELGDFSKDDLLISVDDLKDSFSFVELNTNIELLIIKTGFCYKRNKDEYWEYNLGFDVGTAKYIKNIYPNIRAIAFDLISLSSYQNRQIGRIVHKEYLLEEDIIIIEDVDLREVSKVTKFEEIIISPLRIKKADGAPATIIATI